MKLETKLKHTRGPWEPLYVSNALDGKLSDDYDVDVYGGDQPDGLGLLVAKLPIKDQNDILICEDEVRANARLIAAAPDLLDALRFIAREIATTPHELDDALLGIIKIISYKAITKAIGKNQE